MNTTPLSNKVLIDSHIIMRACLLQSGLHVQGTLQLSRTIHKPVHLSAAFSLSKPPVALPEGQPAPAFSSCTHDAHRAGWHRNRQPLIHGKIVACKHNHPSKIAMLLHLESSLMPCATGLQCTQRICTSTCVPRVAKEASSWPSVRARPQLAMTMLL